MFKQAEATQYGRCGARFAKKVFPFEYKCRLSPTDQRLGHGGKETDFLLKKSMSVLYFISMCSLKGKTLEVLRNKPGASIREND